MKEKLKTVYVCSECGETYHKWQGQCSACKAWNTLEEDVLFSSLKLFQQRTVPLFLQIQLIFRNLIKLTLMIIISELKRVLVSLTVCLAEVSFRAQVCL